MKVQHITAERLKASAPASGCCDCTNEVDQAPDNEIWTIWNGERFYCPACAHNECIGPND